MHCQRTFIVCSSFAVKVGPSVAPPSVAPASAVFGFAVAFVLASSEDDMVGV